MPSHSLEFTHDLARRLHANIGQLHGHHTDNQSIRCAMSSQLFFAELWPHDSS